MTEEQWIKRNIQEQDADYYLLDRCAGDVVFEKLPKNFSKVVVAVWNEAYSQGRMVEYDKMKSMLSGIKDYFNS